jgi:acetate kinase
MRVLVLNPGSSTLKGSLMVDGQDAAPSCTVEWPAEADGAEEVVGRVLEAVDVGAIDAIGYRVVHGGSAYQRPALVDEALLTTVEALDALAPLHNRRSVSVIRAGLGLKPEVRHVACFDTAFHATLPEEAWRYPLPDDWTARRGIRKFGFHGLSAAWATRRAAELLGTHVGELRLVVAHLGSGCSVTAVDRGRSVETSMGYTPFEGLMMGTRSGSIDPGILLQLAADGVAVDELADGMAHRSGLLAIGGTSSARDLERRADAGDAAAKLALGMFERRAAAAIAAATTALPSLDAVVFTGGIGENATGIRSRIVGRLGVIGLGRPLSNGPADAVLDDGPPGVLAVIAREDLVIAREVAELLR